MPLRVERLCLINLLYSGTARATSWRPARHIRHTAIAAAASCLIHLHHNWVDNALKLLLLRFKLVFLSKLILVQPIQGLLHGFLNLLFIITLKLILELLLRQSVAHGKAVILQAVLGLDFRFVLLILSAKLLRFLHHAIDVRL